MEMIKKMGIVMVCIVMALFMVVPVMATPPELTPTPVPVFIEDPQPAHGIVNYYQDAPLEISLVDPLEVNVDLESPDVYVDNDVDVHNDFAPVNDVDVTNRNYNTNLNLNVNDNDNVNNNYNTNVNNVEVDQSQKQNQNQVQLQLQQQDQKQKQSQTQANVQVVNVDVPKGADGGILVSNSNKAPTVTQLDVGNSEQISRLVYPGEVLTYTVKNGDIVFLKAASDVGLYTVGYFAQDEVKVASSEATPGYDPITHKLTFGFVAPVDKINFWTTKATLVPSADAKWVVVDNRAPRNGYTHIELTIVYGEPVEHVSDDIEPVVLKPDVYPVDSYGRAITS